MPLQNTLFHFSTYKLLGGVEGDVFHPSLVYVGFHRDTEGFEFFVGKFAMHKSGKRFAVCIFIQKRHFFGGTFCEIDTFSGETLKKMTLFRGNLL